MKKTFLSIAFLAAGIFAFNASAQEQCCNTSQQCCEGGNDACCQVHAKPEASNLGALEGLNLTPEQQASINALHEKYVQARKDGKKAKLDARKEERKESRENYLNEMKQILTPEQYATFLENMALNTPGKYAPKPDGRKHDKKDRNKDGKKDRHKGNKKDRKAQPTNNNDSE